MKTRGDINEQKAKYGAFIIVLVHITLLLFDRADMWEHIRKVLVDADMGAQDDKGGTYSRSHHYTHVFAPSSGHPVFAINRPFSFMNDLNYVTLGLQ